MNFSKKSAVIFFLTSFPLFISATNPEDITYMTEDYPPSNYIENGVLKGVAVDVLKAVWKKINSKEMHIQLYHWARGYQLALTKPNTMLFAMTRSPEREKLFKWVGPIYRGRYSLFTLS
jgi:polar amino acid transport system substrate-binding protein